MGGTKKSIAQLSTLYKEVMELLSGSGIDFILFYGTLLGQKRDNEFIDGDDDIDVLIKDSEYPKLRKYVESNIRKFPNLSFGLKEETILQLHSHTIGPFDIYTYSELNDDILLPWDGNLLISKVNLFPCNKIKFKGFDVLIPANADAICEEMYGPMWKTPQRKDIDYIWKDVTKVRILKDKRS